MGNFVYHWGCTSIRRPLSYPFRTLKKSGVRPIVIDGCNVAFEHGKNEDLSVKAGLDISFE